MTNNFNHFFFHHNSARQAQVELEKRSKRRARMAIRSRGDNRDRIEVLEDQVYFLNIVNRCVVNLLLKRGLCSEDELHDLFAQLDEEDGLIDGGSTTDDLAQEMGFDESPVDRPDLKREAPKSTKSPRHRRP